MPNSECGRGGWVGAFCSRHPLFLAALVAAACVLTAERNLYAGLGLAAVLGMGGGFFRGWRVGLGWLVCGSLAVGVFTWRNEARKADERRLLENPGGLLEGRVLKDAKGKANLWNAPAELLTGPRAGAVVWWEGRGELPVAGSRVKARGNFGPLPVMRNPGEFDQAGWLRSQGVAAIFHAGWVKGEVTTGEWSKLGARLRRGFRTAVTDGLAEDSQEAVVIRAVVIGETPPDADQLVAAFRNSGTLHALLVFR